MTTTYKCGDNRFEIIEKAKKDLVESTNISSSEEEMKVIDNFLFRCWQMDWLDNYNDEQVNTWIKIDNEHPLPKFEEILGYNKEWIEVDFNPKGVRIGYLTDEGNFISAKYEPDGEDYISKYEEGDDYQFFQTQEGGTMKTWYNNGDDRGDIEGYRPNLPTHYMRISIDGIKKK